MQNVHDRMAPAGQSTRIKDMSPQELEKKVKSIEQRILELEKRVKLSFGLQQPDIYDGGYEQDKQIRKLSILRQTAGSLKGKIKGDPVKWQRKIRAEWNERT